MICILLVLIDMNLNLGPAEPEYALPLQTV